MGVTVLRQYFSYGMVDPSSLRVTLDITMKVTKQSYFLLPVKGHLADLMITDSEGKSMIILSDHEFVRQFKISLNDFKEKILENMKQESNEQIKNLVKEHRNIAVMFNRTDDEYYDKIKISWTEKIMIRKYGPISNCLQFHVKVPRYGLKRNSLSAIYVSIKSNPKHEILGSPKIINVAGNKQLDFISILDEVNHKIYRFEETEDVQFIEIDVKMGVPNAVISWAKLSGISAIVIPSILALILFGTSKVLPFTFELMAGLIALLISQRMLIFRDIPLMKRWNHAHHYLIISSLVMLMVMMIYANPTIKQILPNI